MLPRRGRASWNQHFQQKTDRARVSESCPDQIHWRAANETRNEHLRGLPKECQWIGNLNDISAAHNADAVAHRHRFDLVMGQIFLAYRDAAYADRT